MLNLERYLDLKRQKDSTIPTVRLLPNSEVENKELALPEEKTQLSDSVIVENIPKTMRSRAVALLNRLKARLDVISWDETGRVMQFSPFVQFCQKYKTSKQDSLAAILKNRQLVNNASTSK